jgi:cysteinyl-tRNA synthetase
MAHDLLGDAFDIHGGGIDLQFPHHENEIAQSCCAHPDAGFANFWLHNEMVQVEGKKMSKSLGNFFTVRDLLDQGWPGEVIRFVMLSTHYRKPMDWTAEKAREAENTLRRWRGMVADCEAGAMPEGVVSALADDLNTAGAISELHRLAAAAQAPALKAGAGLLGLLTPELGGWETVSVDLDALADRLDVARAHAKRTKDFSEVDRMKAALVAAGVEVRMSKDGVDLVPAVGFDPAKLDGLT